MSASRSLTLSLLCDHFAIALAGDAAIPVGFGGFIYHANRGRIVNQCPVAIPPAERPLHFGGHSRFTVR
jgi:hypothetical protein